MILEFTDLTAQEEINTGNMVVIDFKAVWCAPCQAMGPIINKLSEKYGDIVKIGKIDVDDNNDLTQAYGVRNIPTILFFKNGEVVDRQVGVVSQDKLEEKIENLIKL